MVRRIYRLTSVYGYARPGQRLGLIGTLLLNGLRQRVSSISGRMSTLRDFTWVEDIARFMAGDMLNPEHRTPLATYLLASGTPSSIRAIQKIIEDVIGRAIYVSYAQEPSNFEDTTFERVADAGLWVSSDLRTNIKKIYYEALSNAVTFEPGSHSA